MRRIATFTVALVIVAGLSYGLGRKHGAAESLTPCGVERAMAQKAGAVPQADVARAGGITEIRKIAAMGAAHGRPISFHTWGDAIALAASVHLSAAIKECIVMELDYTYNPLRAELLRDPLELQRGYLRPPEGPGLGVEVEPDALQRFAFSGSETLSVRQKTLGAV